MGSTNTIIIPLDKRKIWLWLFAVLVMGGVGAWILQNSDTFTNYLAKRYASPVGIAFVILTPILGIFYTIKLFSKAPGFIISDEGITDNSSMNSNGLIPWQEITGFGQAQISIRKCITFTLANPQAFIDASSGFRRFNRKSTYKRYGVSGILTAAILKCSDKELLTYLTEGLERYSKSE